MILPWTSLGACPSNVRQPSDIPTAPGGAAVKLRRGSGALRLAQHAGRRPKAPGCRLGMVGIWDHVIFKTLFPKLGNP